MRLQPVVFTARFIRRDLGDSEAYFDRESGNMHCVPRFAAEFLRKLRDRPFTLDQLDDTPRKTEWGETSERETARQLVQANLIEMC